MEHATRRGILSIDDLLGCVRTDLPSAETVAVAWDRRHRSAAVVGLLDEDRQLLDVSTDELHRLTACLANPLVPDVLRLTYSDADLALSGQVVLNVPVDEPAWARVLDHVAARVSAG